jgi:hypothetical protein
VFRFVSVSAEKFKTFPFYLRNYTVSSYVTVLLLRTFSFEDDCRLGECAMYLAEINHRFRDAYCVYRQGDESALMMEVVSTSEMSVNFYETTLP